MTHCFTKDVHQCHENKIFTARFFPNDPNLVYSGGWDRIVKFWDVRHAHILTNYAFGTQTCADSIDMHADHRTFVTGGGTGGEGLKIWDFRNTEQPVLQLNFSPGETRNPWIEPFISGVRFIPNTKYIITTATDAQYPSKVFNYETGALVHKFHNKCGRTTACDVVPSDGLLLAIGDETGQTTIMQKES